MSESTRIVRKLMSADYQKYCVDIYARHPIQLQNRATYDAFDAQAALGVMTSDVRLKGGRIAKGTVVLFVPYTGEAADGPSVQVWYQGALAPCIVRQHKLKPF